MCEVVANQRPSKQFCICRDVVDFQYVVPAMAIEQPSYPACYCGIECEVVVCRTKKNAGRRFDGCNAYNYHRINPDQVGCCSYFDWLDPPICPRRVENALKVQAEVSRLEKLNRELRGNIWFRPTFCPNFASYGPRRASNEK